MTAYEARQVALAEAADPEVARHLRIRPGRPVLVLERTYFGRDDRPIEFSRSRHRTQIGTSRPSPFGGSKGRRSNPS